MIYNRNKFIYIFSKFSRTFLSPAELLNRLNSIINKFKIKTVGKNFYAAFPIFLKNSKDIHIGKNFSSMGFTYLYADEGLIKIGDNCSLNTNIILGASKGKILIGDNVLIGPNVVIRASNHGIKKNKTIKKQEHKYGEILIEDDVWIGSNAVITSGVTLRMGTVVGAGAVVTKSTQPYCIVGGVPAKKISERI